ncbi:MAG: undecaprenyldiphospho-muramoylpentapeptide beta-N-acetylglucosaminyltransferase [Candidatus Buchananbacteria bacterium RIFCSPHIGHO2_02_FULL_38_8]|uniref:UDP-N-acetylglucosamine--N-acetylmuramyl-(pentapeptide) pyrophosphoryl-undecaprenol N-acetylglucosamine transferase n=2 Tax=Candidatus Buchananiibacteriota TaxID=1817903 RepID=A0A1G1Y0S0_9BACT|nr:MAG: undecaprenyldiphospho-muramoylpentapeptide beta-N-acetylglucosaminyltransferase [Candidatus Buchananbacteria bacterium RIFCSPHIGHO2_01_FULL_39_8]OGY47860.1 MAG: undecaprenyldiphospho-muramoylpentapeptide beta-N-acetylglucosaminyltransferase [Candidatus Buchananbacteria bacterium RIFCSPHIGHO2_02_FULL_38_8]
MRIILSGGGTIGSVSPLIALFEEIKKQHSEAEFLWVATRSGLEYKLIKDYNISIRSIFSGKFRRYFSFRNLLDLFLIKLGFFQSLFIILSFKPDVILSAGGFVSVPLVWAGWLLRKPSLIIQQDVKPGLANKLMAPFAKIIAVTFEKSLSSFPPNKTVLVGNPVRRDILSGNEIEAYRFFKLNPEIPTILVIGGGTGALSLNSLILGSLPKLVNFCQVIHLTGGRIDKTAEHPRYRSYDFLSDQLKNAYAMADVVVCRAGMGTLTEVAALGKPTIIIPIPGSHQEENASEFLRNNAALVIEQKNLTAEGFVEAIKELLTDEVELNNLSQNIRQVMPSNAAEEIAKMII